MKNTHYMTTLFILVVDIYHLSSSIELNVKVSGSGGEITSPNYPQNYPLNLTCTWTINVESHERIVIKFIDFQLEQAKRCIHDNFQVREDLTKSWSTYPKYCGKNHPREIETTASVVQLRFSSDRYNIVDRGFKLQWIAKQDKTAVETKVVPCPTRSTTTKIVTVCPTPLPSQSNCKCEDGSSSILQTTASGVDPSNGCNNKQHSDCNAHAIKRSQEKTDTVVIAAFSTLLALFILVCAVLIIMLWRRTKELEYLRTPPKSPDFQWIPGNRFSTQNYEHQNRAQDGSLLRQITNASKLCDNQDCTLCSLNRHLNRYTGSTYETNDKTTLPNGKELYSNPFPRLLGVTESRPSIQTDNNSIAESETSDIYMSSCLHSPADTFERELPLGIYPAKCAV